VVYNYAPGRGAEHAVALLKGFTGVLQTDGYTAYRSLADPKRNTDPVSLAYCWAHCRRQFFELAKSAPAPIATEALRRIAELYEIEADIRGKSADERRAVRQQKTKPLIEALKTWLEKPLAQVPGRSNIAKAIRYALKHWEGSPASSMTAASRSTPTPSSALCARLPSPEKMPSSPAATRGRKTGRCSPR
jgi:transposase